MTKIAQIQQIIGVTPDGLWGPQSKIAFERLIHPPAPPADPSGTMRKDWRGFKAVPAEKLKWAMPTVAHPLIPMFMVHAISFDLNPLFLIAISKHETGNWTSKAFREMKNAMGISDKHGVIPQPAHDDSIRHMAKRLSQRDGPYGKCVTLQDVADVYAPPGAMNDPGTRNKYWPRAVAKYWAELEEVTA